jgi:hypothetical protein
MKEILVEIIGPYGVETVHVVNRKTSEAISSLTGRKTLSLGDIVALKSLGFQFRAKKRAISI